MSEKINVDFGGWIQRGFDIWKDNILTLAIATLIASCISAVSFGILGGPMGAGLTMMVLAMHDKTQPKPQIGDLFKGFQLFVPALLLMLVLFGASLVIWLLNLIPCVGQIVSMLGSIAFSALMMFAMCFLVDKRLPVMDAVKASMNTVMSNFWPFLGLNVVVGAIAAAGVLACCVGIFASAPIAACIIAVAYRSITSGGAIETTTVEPPPADTAAS